ncbi:MAG: M20/M25/M40 family metallo-hydrolase, partial [Gemmatimonadota bacterium]
EAIRAWCDGRGIRAWLEAALPGRPNAVAEIGPGEGPTLVLCAHTDTVSASGMEISPFEARVEGNRLYGRGAYDMKAGAAAILCALAALRDALPRGRVLAAFVADEEYVSAGAFDFVKRHTADACILTEFSGLEPVTAHKGFVWARLTTHGTAAHGSRWELGVSAIGRIGRIIAALEQYDAEVLRARTHPLVGSASMHCTLVRGGDGPSTYASSCTLELERRTLPGEDAEMVLEELHQIVRDAAEEADIELLLERAPLETPVDAPVATCLAAALEAETGVARAPSGVAYWMDAAVFAGAGIPAVNLGPDGAGAHAAVEWADIDSTVTCARVLARAALKFCGG